MWLAPVVGGLVVAAVAVGLVVLGGGHDRQAAAPAAPRQAPPSTARPAPVTVDTGSVPGPSGTLPGGETPEDAGLPSFEDDGLPDVTRAELVTWLSAVSEPEMAACVAGDLFSRTDQDTVNRIVFARSAADRTTLEQAIWTNAVLACVREVIGGPAGDRAPGG